MLGAPAGGVGGTRLEGDECRHEQAKDGQHAEIEEDRVRETAGWIPAACGRDVVALDPRVGVSGQAGRDAGQELVQPSEQPGARVLDHEPDSVDLAVPAEQALRGWKVGQDDLGRSFQNDHGDIADRAAAKGDCPRRVR